MHAYADEHYPVETPKPKIFESTDVIVKVTGSTICGSDLHLLHGDHLNSLTFEQSLIVVGSVIELQKGDILGHEFCGVVESVGSGVNNLKVGQRVVASFQIACGSCMYCKRKLSSQCENTNDNTIENAMYGGRTAGMIARLPLTELLNRI